MDSLFNENLFWYLAIEVDDYTNEDEIGYPGSDKWGQITFRREYRRKSISNDEKRRSSKTNS